MSLVAFKTYLQAPTNPENVPTEWPYLQETIEQEQMESYILQGFQVLSPEAFAAYLDAHDEAYSAWQAAKNAQLLLIQQRVELQKRREFGADLLIRFKEKNISEGIAWMQAIHLHSRIRQWKVTFPTAVQFPSPGYAAVAAAFQGRSCFVDLSNMMVDSGDIETTCLALMFGEDDDMSLPEHWVTSTRRNWLINEMKTWLGWV